MSISVRLPDYVQDLYNFFIDNEDYGNIQTHPTQSRYSTFVESEKNRRKLNEAVNKTSVGKAQSRCNESEQHNLNICYFYNMS